MSLPSEIQARVDAFCADYDLSVPVLMAPMAGACPPELAIAVGQAGGMGACGALLFEPDQIADWARKVRAGSNGAFQMNLWVPDPEPVRNKAHEDNVRAFLGEFGPEPDEKLADTPLIDFEAQFDALLDAGPAVVSSIMGVFSDKQVARLKERGVKWYATVTTVAEARLAESAGADVLVAQGMEAGGHRGAFNAEDAEKALIGLSALLPAVVDAVSRPVVATGGIGDARAVAAALMLGASAVQIGTALLRTPEASIAKPWADGMIDLQPEGTGATRAFSGRLGRSIVTDYTRAFAQDDNPDPAPYPIQRALTGPMRAQAAKDADLQRMQAWAGQSSRLAEDRPAGDVVSELWTNTLKLFD